MDIRKVPLKLVTALQLPERETLQSIAALSNGQFLVTQAIASGVPSEHGVVSLVNPDGELQSSMYLYRAGHMSSFAVREIEGEAYFYCIWNDTNLAGKTIASKFVEVKYTPNLKTSMAKLSDVQVKSKDSKLTNGWTGAAFDETNNLAALRRRLEPTKEFFEWRKLDDFLAGKDDLIAKTDLFPSGSGVVPGIQSYAVDNNLLYRLTGNSSQSDPTTLRVWDFREDKAAFDLPLSTLGGAAAKREPEGLYLHRQNGLTTLYVGVTTRDAKNNYVSLIYGLAESEEHPMRASVKGNWFDTISIYEASQGTITWIYFDTHNPPWATTGIGNLIEGTNKLSDEGKALPWKTKDGKVASQGQIQDEYIRLKNLHLKGSGYAYKVRANLFLDIPVVEALVARKRDEFFASLVKQFPDIENWPADAQMAIMIIAWWTGPNFTHSWPTTSKHLRAGKFFDAAAELRTSNQSDRIRDAIVMFENAGAVAALKGFASANVYYGPDKAPSYVNPVVDNQLSALKRVDASTLNAADPNVFDHTGWYVQRMLAATKDYTLKVDGEFGPRSKAAYAAFAKRNGVSTKPDAKGLDLLADKSGILLPGVA